MQAKLVIISIIFVLVFCNTFGNASIILSENYYQTSCKDLNEVQLKRDIIQIQVNVEKEPFFVKCNQKLEGGGWTVVLNRYDGKRDFNCKWNECVQGFGNKNDEFFIGLEKLHDITSSALHELLFVMEDFDGNSTTARYDAFVVDNEKNSFMISVLGNYTGDAGDSFAYEAGHKFATKDKDSPLECAKKTSSPGWFNYCSFANIFGKYAKGVYERSFLLGNALEWISWRILFFEDNDNAYSTSCSLKDFLAIG